MPIQVQLDKIYQKARYCRVTQVNYQILPQYEEIQRILKGISGRMNKFYTDLVEPELRAWGEIVRQYRDSANTGTSGHQRKILLGIFLALAGLATIIGFLVCPPVGGVVGGAAVGGAATTAAVGTTTAAVSTGTWFVVGGAGCIGMVGMVFLGLGLKEHRNLSSDDVIYKEVERVLELWEQFKTSYFNVGHDIEYIVNKEVGPGPGWMWNDSVAKIVADNIVEIGTMSQECIGKIKKST